MKPSFKFLSFSSLLIGLTFSACTKNTNEIPDPEPGNDIIELRGNLSTQTLVAGKKYLIKGQTFVKSGQTLTLEPGTVLMGEKRSKGTLIIDRGGRIIANGTATNPIVLTSDQREGDRDRGDWGGLLILGNSATNQVDPAIEGIDPASYFGGNPANVQSSNTINDTESSGSLKYVRIEFAGIELTPNNETNTLTMGGVGRGTVIEYVMASFGGDDSFEWFGGTVNAKYLISFAGWDDDFDVDYGWSGNVQYGLAIRYPSYADQSGSNIFEMDNGPNDNDVQPYTTGTFSNITGIGPIRTGSTTGNGNFQHAIDLRRRVATSIMNSVFIGMPRGLRMNQASVVGQYQSGRGVLSNNILVAPAAPNDYFAGSGVSVADVKSLWESTNTTIAGAISDATFSTLGLNTNIVFSPGQVVTNYPSAPGFTVTTGTLATGASFSHAKFSEPNRTGFFENVSYIGAFGATNWTTGWADFRPVDKTYY
jgi:hypothetical protein